MKSLIRRAIQNEDLVLVLTYTDSKGEQTRRVVSPIRFLGNDRFLALCLSREEPRQFYFDRCSQLSLDRASHYIMPVPIHHLPSPTATLQCSA